VDVGKRGGVPAARHHEKSGNSRKLSGPSVFGLKPENHLTVLLKGLAGRKLN